MTSFPAAKTSSTSPTCITFRSARYFDEPEIGKLAKGQPVRIVWEAKPGKQWHGHILRVPTTIMSYQGTRNVGECISSVDDNDGDMIPNTNVTVTVTEAQRSNVLTIPREALHSEGGRDFVYRIVGGAAEEHAGGCRSGHRVFRADNQWTVSQRSGRAAAEVY